MDSLPRLMRLALMLPLTGLLLVPAASSSDPSISLSRPVGPPTTMTTVIGTGFDASEWVEVRFDDKGWGRSRTDPAGAFSVRVEVPASALPGGHQVQVTGRSSGLTAEATFTVRTDWPTFHASLNRRGHNRFENVLFPDNVAGLVPKWTADATDAINTSPAVAGGRVFVGDFSGRFRAYDAATGDVLWQARFADCPNDPTVAGGVVYVGSCDSTLYALDAQTGATVWSKDTGGGIFGAPAVYGGLVYFGSNEGNLYAVEAGTGATVWTFPCWCGSATPAVAGGVVYIASQGADFRTRTYALDAATGEELWGTRTPDLVVASPALARGMVYVASTNFDPYLIYALNAQSGEIVWTRSMPDTFSSSPAVADGIVYVGNNDDNVYALDADTGRTLWIARTGGNVYSSPAVASGVVYVGSADHRVYALDALSGAVLWVGVTEHDVLSSPAVADGVVYVGSFDFKLYAFHVPD
jgi:outer membrane protein assembly factor BamB